MQNARQSEMPQLQLVAPLSRNETEKGRERGPVNPHLLEILDSPSQGLSFGFLVSGETKPFTLASHKRLEQQASNLLLRSFGEYGIIKF